MFGYNKPQLMAIVFCHKERGISVEEENHLVTVGIVKKSKTILVLLASPIAISKMFDSEGTNVYNEAEILADIRVLGSSLCFTP